MKATHTGTCQACGSIQKLPRGLLAKHGYTTEWGFFRGVCQGSDHLPFEQSKDLIEGFIASAESEAARLDGEAEAYLTHAGPKYLASIYRSYRHCRGYEKPGHVVEEVTVVERGGRVVLVDGRGHEHVQNPGRKLTDVLDDLVRQHSRRLSLAAGRHRDYAAWQRARIAGWEPKPLTPIA